MLFRQKVIERVADALSGVALPSKSARGTADASVLVYQRKKSGADAPLVEITFSENPARRNVMVQSPLGIVELNDVEEIRLSESTREVAFFSKVRSGKTTMVTVSAAGVLQVYGNVSSSLGKKDLTKLDSEDLRAAIALKIFNESAVGFK
ncbi:MAG: hypothetical protein WCH46_08385 [bacterium]